MLLEGAAQCDKHLCRVQKQPAEDGREGRGVIEQRLGGEIFMS